jgi:drug/metabolite transporter (DMT)-like permease
VVVAYLLAALAAFINALVSVLQRLGVETAPASTTLRLSLMTHAFRRGVWLIGFVLSLGQFAVIATALRFGELSIVQPILTTELLFLLLILAVWFRYRLGWREWLGSVTIVIGLGGFFLAAAPKGGHGIPTSNQWLVAYGVLFVVVGGFIVAALRGPRWWRAASFGAATAVSAAFTAALTKATTTYITQGWGHVFTHAQPYLLAITGIGTLFLLQNALHAGPITASRTTLVTINPLVSIALGITLFAEQLRTGVLWITLEAVALAVLIVGVVVLARSPLVAGTAIEGQDEEMLGGARSRAVAGPGLMPGIPSIEAVPSVGGGPVAD